MIAHNPLAQFNEAIKHQVLKPHQIAHLESCIENKQCVHLGARQAVGKTFVLAWCAVLFACGYRSPAVIVPAGDVLIISKDAKTAQKLIREVKRHIDTFERRTGVKILDPKLGSLSRLALRNGNYIDAFSSNPDGVQGMTGHCIVDEWSKGDVNPEELLSQALSITASNPGFRALFATNADYEGSFIHQFLQSPNDEWKARRANMHIQTTTIADVFPGEFPEHIREIQQTIHPSMWERFFMCRFIGSDNPAFPPDILERAEQSFDSIPDDATIVAGLDIGLVNNPCGWVVCALAKGVCYVLEAEHWHQIEPDEIKRRVHDRRARLNIARVYIDDGAVGFQVGRELQAELGKHVAARVSPSDANRSKWHGGAYSLAATGNLRGVTGVLRRDLATMRLTNGESLVVPEYPGPGGCKIHCDAGEALLYIMGDKALANEPAKSEKRRVPNPEILGISARAHF